uniref:S-adenosylmethionine:tRNA ribosyltransferase-isomerase n=1 Tax=candidate division WOR-3 bacterium TaxID=2052148 RepID=A0A7C4GK24_UNCW3
MLVSEFDYELPAELIAQRPLEHRDASRLMVVDRQTQTIADRQFRDIVDLLGAADLLVLNDTKVIPARLFGRLETGGKLELLLLRHLSGGEWEVLARPARKARPGVRLDMGGGFSVQVVERHPDGIRVVRFDPEDVTPLLDASGEVALPPYIRERCFDTDRYQTVYASRAGAVAAPTAGLHFTDELLRNLLDRGVEQVRVTLHAGLGTFRPVKAERVEEHAMHSETFELTPEAAERINAALAQRRRVVCVGTTVVRVLEAQARAGRVSPGQGETSLYIYPGFEWQVTGALLTNFHLPRSTLLMLVSAFAGRDLIMRAYEHAIASRYRFFSFGDAMLIT